MEKDELFQKNNLENLDLSKDRSIQKIKIETTTKAMLAQTVTPENLYDNYCFQNINSESPELTEQLLQEITDFYRYIFNNSFPEYAVCMECDEQISARDAFHSRDYVPLDKIDDVSNLPNCQFCGEEMSFFIDAAQTLENLKEKFKKDALISILREKNTEKMVGIAFGYFDTLKNVVQKEWGNPYNYMERENQPLSKYISVEDFICDISLAIKEAGIDDNIEEEEIIFAWNCAALDDSLFGKGYLSHLMKQFFTSIPNKDRFNPNMKTVFHVLKNEKMKEIVRHAGCSIAENIPDIRYSYVVGQLPEVAHNFSLFPEDFQKRVHSLEKYKELGYMSHELDNPKVELKTFDAIGRSVWARENIFQGEVITEFRGHFYAAEKLSDIPNSSPVYSRDHVVQIGETEYLHGKNGLAECINHSCDPNCGINGRATIVAMRDISKGEQITWDYEMTEDSDWCMENCQCGSSECRHTIRGYSFLPQEKREKYKKFTAEWLLEKYKS
jgi:hypothetical protein